MRFCVGVVTACLVSEGAAEAWWRSSHFAERVLNARAYGKTLNQTRAMLPDLKARGYSVVNLDWPVESGPLSLYGGFGAKDYHQVDPDLGSMADWLAFVDAAHDLSLKVVSWFNPSYFWTGSPAFKRAEADVSKSGIQRKNLPEDSPARWFRWSLDSGDCGNYGDGAVLKPADDEAGSYNSYRWVTDPDAGGACYYAPFSDQPSGDFTLPEWQEEIKSVFAFWVGTGLDGFVLDWPDGYIGFGENNADMIRQVIIEPVHALGDVAVFGEVYNLNSEQSALHPVLDGSIVWGEVNEWGSDTVMDTFQATSIIQAGDPTRLDSGLYPIDTLAAERSIARFRPDIDHVFDGIDSADANVLQAATIASLAGYYALKGTGVYPGPEVEGVDDFGDFEEWDGEDRAALVLRAVQAEAAMRPGTPRLALATSAACVYACIRGGLGCGGAVLVLLNFCAHEQYVTVDLAAAPVALPQTPVELVYGGYAPVLTDRHWAGFMPALGYALYRLEVQDPQCIGAELCGSLEGATVGVDLDELGSTDWLQVGSMARRVGSDQLLHVFDGFAESTVWDGEGLHSFSWWGSANDRSGAYTVLPKGIAAEVQTPKGGRCLLHVLMGAYNTPVTFKVLSSAGATWEDSSLPVASNTSFFGHYVVAAPSDEFLTVRIKMGHGNGEDANINLQALALSCQDSSAPAAPLLV